MDKSTLAQNLLQKWKAIQSKKTPAPACFIGFDGFTDEIVQAVDRRSSQTHYTPFTTIQQFGERIAKAAGKSCNIELVTQKVKLGGNAPIMTNALLNGGHHITFCGPIGTPGDIEPVFQEMANRCQMVIPLGPSAHSDAIEFEDGKVIFGKMASIKNVTYQSILTHISRAELLAFLDQSDLFVCANWTMLPMMNDLWERILDEITPSLTQKKRYLFVDLADPAKRLDHDLKHALQLLQKLNAFFEVHLGLNEAEAQRIHQVLTGKTSSEKLQNLAETLKKLTFLSCIIIHASTEAASANSKGNYHVKGPYTPTPKLTTGAGDNFNAGYCNGLLYGLDQETCLLSGVATSGFYVREARSPSIADLADFLMRWDAQTLE